MEKQCFTCEKLILWDDPKDCPFGKLTRSKDGLRSSCKNCVRDSFRLYRRINPDHSKEIQQKSYTRNKSKTIKRSRDWAANNPEKRQKSLLKTKYVTQWASTLASQCRSRFRDVPCEIDAKYIKTLFEKQNRKCYWLGIPLVLSVTSCNPRRPSIDRLDNTKGYTKENIVLCSQFANLGRRSTTFADFTGFVKELKEHILTKRDP